MARSRKKHEAVASASDSSVKAPAQAATVSGNEFTEFIETARRTEDEALSGFIEPFKDRLTDVAV